MVLSCDPAKTKRPVGSKRHDRSGLLCRSSRARRVRDGVIWPSADGGPWREKKPPSADGGPLREKRPPMWVLRKIAAVAAKRSCQHFRNRCRLRVGHRDRPAFVVMVARGVETQGPEVGVE